MVLIVNMNHMCSKLVQVQLAVQVSRVLANLVAFPLTQTKSFVLNEALMAYSRSQFGDHAGKVWAFADVTGLGSR